MICSSFITDDNCYRHKCESSEPKYSIMFYNKQGESCGVLGTIDEIATILAYDDTALNSFAFIGESTRCLEDEEFLDRFSRLVEAYMERFPTEINKEL